MQLTRSERGDTIIEVMLSIIVFSFVSVMSFSIMNRGAAIAQQALEVTQVRAQMDAQTSAIRYIHQLRVAGQDSTGEWNKMLLKSKASASSFGSMVSGQDCRPFGTGQNPFIVNARTAKVRSAAPSLVAPVSATMPPYPQVIYNSGGGIDRAYGIWIEAVRVSSSTFVGYIDFHIRACWQTPGSPVPATLGTIVRLYDPAS